MTPAQIIDFSYSSPIAATEYSTLSSEDLQALKVMLQNEVDAKTIQISKNAYLRDNRIANAVVATQLIELQRAARKVINTNIETIEAVIQEAKQGGNQCQHQYSQQ